MEKLFAPLAAFATAAAVLVSPVSARAQDNTTDWDRLELCVANAFATQNQGAYPVEAADNFRDTFALGVDQGFLPNGDFYVDLKLLNRQNVAEGITASFTSTRASEDVSFYGNEGVLAVIPYARMGRANRSLFDSARACASVEYPQLG